MHKSQLSAIVIDCQTKQLDEAARFWAAALGLESQVPPDASSATYRELRSEPEELKVLVQSVDHASRVHIDIESDDVEAEVGRLEALGAKRVARVKTWWVMESPTGQRFCVVRPQRANFEATANTW